MLRSQMRWSFSAMLRMRFPWSKRQFSLAPMTRLWAGSSGSKGRAYFTLGDYPNAIKALKESVRARPNLWYAQAWLVAAYALSSKDKEAGKALEAFKKAPFSSRYDLDRITQYYKEEQFQNPTLQRATAEMLNGLRKAGLK